MNSLNKILFTAFIIFSLIFTIFSIGIFFQLPFAERFSEGSFNLFTICSLGSIASCLLLKSK